LPLFSFPPPFPKACRVFPTLPARTVSRPPVTLPKSSKTWPIFPPPFPSPPPPPALFVNDSPGQRQPPSSAAAGWRSVPRQASPAASWNETRPFFLSFLPFFPFSSVNGGQGIGPLFFFPPLRRIYKGNKRPRLIFHAERQPFPPSSPILRRAHRLSLSVHRFLPAKGVQRIVTTSLYRRSSFFPFSGHRQVTQLVTPIAWEDSTYPDVWHNFCSLNKRNFSPPFPPRSWKAFSPLSMIWVLLFFFFWSLSSLHERDSSFPSGLPTPNAVGDANMPPPLRSREDLFSFS